METLIKKINNSTELVYSEVYKKLCIKKKIEEHNQAYFEQLKEISAPFMSKVFETTPKYVMFEFIEGNTLDQYITLYGALDSEMLNKVLLDICECLLVLHDNNFIHRDIKPQNIVVSESGEGFLIDFNAMREVKQTKGQDTELLGTRGYASPEHYGFTETDKRSDIYSLGVVIRYCVEGTDNYTLYESLINKCTQVDPNNRYQDIDEIINLLKIMEMSLVREGNRKQKVEISEKKVEEVAIGKAEESVVLKKEAISMPKKENKIDAKSVLLVDKIVLGVVFGITVLIGAFLTYVFFNLNTDNAFHFIVLEKIASALFLISLLMVIPGLILLVAYFVLKIVVKKTGLLKWFLVYLGVGVGSIILSSVLVIVDLVIR